MPSSTTKKASAPTKLSDTQFLPTATQPKEEKIRLLAYTKWEDAGSPDGADEQFWLEAENELIEAEDFE